jgi:hypothetical protein
VNKAAPKITWAKPGTITYSTALSNTQLDATASVSGSFVYSPPAGTVPPGGSNTLSVTFTPTGTTDYATATGTVTLTVNKATSTTTISSVNPYPSVIGQQVTVSFTVSGSGVSSTGTVTVTATTGQTCSGTLSAGAGSCKVTFTATGSPKVTASYPGDGNYNTSKSASVTEVVQQ